jgi:peptidoglycan/LPS O-acetylase OafA/YrhL
MAPEARDHAEHPDRHAEASRHGGASHLPALDGIRGVAIVLVLCAHGARFLPHPERPLVHVAVVLLNLGWCGVQLFFVLSGFLITRLLIVRKDRMSRSRVFTDFYARRALRIFPLYYVALGLVFLIRGLGGVRLGPPASGAWWYLLYAQNWYNAAGRIPEAVGHFWSLAIEEQFYIVWPFVVIGCARRSLARACVGMVTGVVLVRLVAAYGFHASAIWLYHSTATQLDGLAMGALLAAVASEGGIERSARAAGIAVGAGLLAVGALVLVSRSSAVFGATTTPFAVAASLAFSLTFMGVLLHVVAWPESRTAAALRMSPLRAAGRISYGLYIVHYPISWALAHPAFSAVPRTLALVLYVALSIGAALVSWRVVERPFIQLKDRLGQRGEPVLAARPS